MAVGLLKRKFWELPIEFVTWSNTKTKTQKPLVKENTALTMKLQHISRYTHKNAADL